MTNATMYRNSRRGYTAVPYSPQIRLAMKFNQMSARELARRSGLSVGTIGNVLGARESCNPETAGRVAKALGLDTSELFTLKRIDYAA